MWDTGGVRGHILTCREIQWRRTGQDGEGNETRQQRRRAAVEVIRQTRYCIVRASGGLPLLNEGPQRVGLAQLGVGVEEHVHVARGVLVPSFGMNSALGGIPSIGDLVVGRDGEGVFSLTYSVRGSLEKANVSVNPLSALAPGVIRRIFENPADTEIPEAQTRSDDEPIPSELPPIPEEEF